MNIISPPEKNGKFDPLSAGIPKKILEDTIVLPFNSLDAVKEVVENERVAMIILEPIPHNVGCILPREGYLSGLREICDDYGIILVFDEVVTGFRHHIGGLQALWNVIPDLTTLGKGMANGYPFAAIGGKAEYMDRFQPAGGDVFCGGTYSSHPAAMALSLLQSRRWRQKTYTATSFPWARRNERDSQGTWSNRNCCWFWIRLRNVFHGATY